MFSVRVTFGERRWVTFDWHRGPIATLVVFCTSPAAACADTMNDERSKWPKNPQVAESDLSVAPSEGAIFLPHLSLVLPRAFLSPSSLAERSSPSRVRYAAPNTGAPLTAPRRSQTTSPGRPSRRIPNASRHLPTQN